MRICQITLACWSVSYGNWKARQAPLIPNCPLGSLGDQDPPGPQVQHETQPVFSF